MSEIEVDIDKEVYLPCYQHLLEDNDIDIELIWGGRDSGKSKVVAQLLTEECMSADYFRCLLIKQTRESIKDAQWQMIKDTCEEDWHVDSLFNFKSSPLGISCINGNTFTARGLDNPGKLRSFTNPSHAWGEEMNQTTEESFITILTGLRNDKGRVKLYLTFNPESSTSDFREFWLYKMFFARYEAVMYNPTFTSELRLKVKIDGKDKEVALKYRSTHVTYHDNPYVSPQRIAFHESLKETNYYWYKVFTLGEWGNKENDNPWAFAFDRKKHVAQQELFADRGRYLFCSFDFNRKPAACTIIQREEENNKVNVIECIKLMKSGTDAICDRILTNYPGFTYIVNGDYSGNTPSSLYEEEVTNYTVIKNKLNIGDAQLKIKPNPSLQKNQTLVNGVFQKVNVQMCPVKAKPLIFDCENVRNRADGTIVKDNRNDPAQQADFLDTWRYFCNEELEFVLTMILPPAAEPKYCYSNDQTRIIGAAALGQDGPDITCTKADYFATVRSQIVATAKKWIEQKEILKAGAVIAELESLDAWFAKK